MSLAQTHLITRRSYKELWLLPTGKYEVLQGLGHCLLYGCKITSRWTAFKKSYKCSLPHPTIRLLPFTASLMRQHHHPAPSHRIYKHRQIWFKEHLLWCLRFGAEHWSWKEISCEGWRPALRVKFSFNTSHHASSEPAVINVLCGSTIFTARA